MAKINYQRVLEIEPQHSQGLGFLGMVYHHLGEIEKAIVKYHEVNYCLGCGLFLMFGIGS